MDLDDLLRRFVIDGDAPAMEELVRRTRPRLLRIARRIGASQDGEDAVQAAYHALIRRAARADDAGGDAHPLGAPVVPWLVTAVVRIAYRHKAVAQRRPDAAALLARWPDEEGPVERAIRREAADASRAEVAKLPSKYRDAMVLHYLDGLPVDEVATLLGVSGSAVKMRLLRGRALLRSRMGPRFAGALLWIPWLVSDSGASLRVGGGLLMKNKVAVVVAVLLAVTATLVGLERASTQEPGQRREVRGALPEAGRARGAPDVGNGDTGARDTPDSTRATAGAFISGRVVDASGAPVSDAEIHVTQYLKTANGTRVRSSPFFYPDEVGPACLTDGAGAFAVGEPVERLDSVYVVKPGYAAVRVSFRRSVRTGLRIVLKEGARATGVVRDTEGRPLAGARVVFMVKLVVLAVHADAAGRYAFDTLPSPPWRRLAGAPGYESFSDPLTPGTRDAGDFRLRRSTVIVEPRDVRTGMPVEKARGVLVRAGSGELLASIGPTVGPGVDDVRYPRGRLYASRLPEFAGAGRTEFFCHVFAPGYRPAVRRFGLAEDGQPPHLRVDLEPGTGKPVLTGRVEGVRSATVEVRHYEPRGFGSRPDDRKPLLQTVGTSGHGGGFAIAGLPPGRYRLIVRGEGMGTDARDVTVPARDLVIGLQPAARLTVVGVDQEGGPVADAWVHVEPAGSMENAVREQRTGADGRSVFEGLPAGRLLVCPARFQGFSAQRRGVPLEEVRLAPGGNAELRVEIPQAGPFVLEFVDAEERPLVGLGLEVHARRGFGQLLQPTPRGGLSATTDESGRARLDLYPGIYDAVIKREGAVRTFPFEVGAKRRRRLVVARAPVLRGRVVDATTGVPVKRIRITVTRIGPPVFTDEDGRFVAASPPDGDVTLCLWPDRGPSGVSYLNIPYPHYVRREFGRDAPPTEALVVRLPRIRGSDALAMPVALEVVVTDAATGAPLDGAKIHVSACRDGYWHTLDTVHAGEGGRAAGHLVEADRYRFWVRGPDGTSPRYDVAELERAGGANELRFGVALARGVK